MNAAEITTAIGLHPYKVKNIYLYGSQVYGTADEESDHDMIVVANSMNEAEEKVIGNYNIHIHTPDKFKDDLHDLKMKNLECIFAPASAVLQEKVKFIEHFRIKPEHLKYSARQQSFNSFHKAKLKIIDEETYIGTKSLFHSLRILVFATQILRHGKIVDFAAANPLWEELKLDAEAGMPALDVENPYMWTDLRNKWLPRKMELEKEMDQALPLMDALPILIRK